RRQRPGGVAHEHAILPTARAEHLDAGRDRAAQLAHVIGQGRRDAPEVDDARVVDAQRGEPLAGGLAGGDLGPGEPPRPPPARLRAAAGLAEPLELGTLDGDDQLAAALVWNPAAGAVLVELARAFDAEPRLQRSGLVVDAGVDHAAVVRALVSGYPRLALE